MTSDHHALHQRAVRFVTRKLRALGCHVDRVQGDRGAVSLSVLRPGERKPIGVAVRASRLHPHHTCTRIGGVAYHYTTQTHFFNTHVHGEVATGTDKLPLAFWCFVPMETPAKTLVVPAAVVGKRKTLALMQAKRPTMALRRYASRWDLVAGVRKLRKVA